ncbi:MAG: T9SS type A sorting domain-containing protein, partial [Crocinitomicaceae bacterium]|nr:T9SS type A sorting domain-containing protein [Crocinitomicaceae bacterium]
PEGIYGTCEISQEVQLQTDPVAFGSLTVTDISCSGANDGCITSTYTGGSGVVSFKIIDNNGNPILDDQGNDIAINNPQYCGLAPGTYSFLSTDANACTSTSAAFTINTPAPLILISGSATPATCYNSTDGVKVVSWSGGSGDVDFSLENDGVFDIEGNPSSVVLNLAPGTYTLYGQDTHGCVDDVTFTISGPPAITITPTISGLDCNGDQDASVTALAGGGSGSFTYSIDNVNFGSSGTFSDLSAGPYTVYAKDGAGCISTLDIVISEPSALTVTALATGVSCFGLEDGSISVLGDGGTSPYTYSIDGEIYQSPNHFDNLPQGSYQVYILDANGCTALVDGVTELEEPAELLATATPSDVSCNGEGDGSVVVMATGGSPDYTYSNGGPFGSNNIFSDLDPGDYTFTVSDAGGCQTTVETSIAEPAPLMVTLDDFGPDTGNGGFINITPLGGTPAYTYEWTGSGGFASQAQDLAGLDAGTYNIVVTDANGCTATLSNNINITGVAEMNSSFTITATPNPTLGQFILRFNGLNGERVSYNITDTQGRVVLNKNQAISTGSRSETIDITGIAAGVYYVNILVGSDYNETIRIIKQ